MKGDTRQGAGRPKGSGQAAHYRAMLEPYAEELIQRVVDMARDGDMAALKLFSRRSSLSCRRRTHSKILKHCCLCQPTMTVLPRYHDAACGQ